MHERFEEDFYLELDELEAISDARCYFYSVEKHDGSKPIYDVVIASTVLRAYEFISRAYPASIKADWKFTVLGCTAEVLRDTNLKFERLKENPDNNLEIHLLSWKGCFHWTLAESKEEAFENVQSVLHTDKIYYVAVLETSPEVLCHRISSLMGFDYRNFG